MQLVKAPDNIRIGITGMTEDNGHPYPGNGAGRYGKQIAEGLGEAGATVFIASRNLEKCEEAAAKFRASGLDVRALQLDLAKQDSIDAVIAEVMKQTGRIDILVNNAVTRNALSDRVQELENYDASLHVNASSYITGTNIPVDGGYTAK